MLQPSYSSASRCAALLAIANVVHAWGETDDEPGGPIDHRNFSVRHRGTGMHSEPDCYPCMDMPEQWWDELKSRGLHPGKRWGPGTKSYLELHVNAFKAFVGGESGTDFMKWPPEYRGGWERPANQICHMPSWGMNGGGTAGLGGCVESIYASFPPKACGGLVNEFTHPWGLMKGTMPDAMKWAVGMVRFEIPGSKLSGTLPDMGLWINMGIFDISDNRFSGTIPNYMLPSPCLQTLNMKGNQFDGTIPPSFNSYTVLMSLNLANNQLSGTIPDFGDMPDLAELDLSGNRLSGTIPNDVWKQHPRLRWLRLHQNRLSGPVPAGLAWTGKVKVAVNRLEHEDSEISVISVRDNPDMDKKIPAEIGTLALRVFNASDDMYCDDPKLLAHVPETQVCGGRMPGGGEKMTADPAPASGPGFQ